MFSVGRYQLLQSLGGGGMAEVYLASEEGPGGSGRIVVIKRVLPHLLRNEQFTKMFLDEARISMRLNHPNIAHIYQVGKEDGRNYLAMEFVHGADLSQILSKHRGLELLTPAVAAFIASRIAQALHHAHNLTNLKGAPLQVVHRDISPQNIRISYEGIVKVIDFGIAKASSNLENTESGVVKGKYPYMSPEQAGGLQLDGRSDLFSLGIILHEMLAGRRLFKREGPVQVLRAITDEVIPPPSINTRRRIPPVLDAIAMKLLERDRRARYATGREVANALEAYLRSDPAGPSELEQLMAELFGEAKNLYQLLPQADDTGERKGDIFDRTPSSVRAIERPWEHTGPPPPRPAPPSIVLGDEQSESAVVSQLAVLRTQRRWLSWSLFAVACVGLLTAATYGFWSGERRQPTLPRQKSTSARADAALRIARLIVRTTPAAATIRVGGELRAELTPTVIELMTNRSVSLELSLGNHQTLTQTLTLRPGEVRTLDHTFKPAPPLLGAPLQLPVRRGARRKQPRNQRRTRVKAKRPPRLDAVKPSETLNKKGSLTIDARPWAIVYVDGKRIDVTPVVNLKISVGRHRILLRNPDRKLERRLTIDVKPGAVIRRLVRF